MRLLVAIACLGVILSGQGWAEGLPPLQPLIDAAGEGGTVTPPPGRYAGPVVITRPLVLDGDGRVTVDGGGHGTVLTVETDGATVKGLRLVNSGSSHNDIDAGIRITGNSNVVKDNVIEDCLFGVDLQKADDNRVRRNHITSKRVDLGLRGDAVRLWYSRENRIEDNEITDSRDMVAWYAADNVFARNTVRGGRYGLHFMYSQQNLVTANHFHGNSVGIILMYSDGLVMRGNRIFQGIGATGVGIGLKESGATTIEDNEIAYCSTGIYLDLSPFQPDSVNTIRRNRLAFNGIGMLFHNDWTGNLIARNRFEDNFIQVSVNARASARRNEWRENLWDDYQGFDRDGDGIGDEAYEPRVYADRLWMDVPWASFFRGSPVLGVLDFLERLAPFSEPIVLLRDERPATRAGIEIFGKAEPVEAPKEFDPFGLRERVH